MLFYRCDPKWPVCLFDFTFRNLNPQFNTYRVEANLDNFVRNNYFSREKLTKYTCDDKYDQIVNDSRKCDVQSLLVSRSPHLCTFKHKKMFKNDDDFQDKFRKRYDANDMDLFKSPYLRFSIDDELEAME